MFGFRRDGKKVKGMSTLDKAEPFFMPMRIDAVNYAQVKIDCASLDSFIEAQREKGNNFAYMHLVIASVVRLMYVRERHNRFIMGGVTYQRNGIFISMDIKKPLTDNGETITLKFPFKGNENLFEVRDIVDAEIAKNLDKNGEKHDATKTVDALCKLPAWMFRATFRLISFLDRHGMLPKFLLHASPFHTSCFLTNLKSIKLNYIYHHLYNFGTTSMFLSMGKEQLEPVITEDEQLGIAKIMNLGFSLDERVADGLYMSKSLRLMQRLLKNPDELLDNLPEKEVQSKKKKKKEKSKRLKKLKTKNATLR